MNDYGMIIEPGTLRIQRLLPGPIERVWAYLTESDKRATAGGRRHDVGKRRAAGAGVSQLRSGGRARTTAGQVQTARRLRQQPRHITCLFPPRLLSFTGPNRIRAALPR